MVSLYPLPSLIISFSGPSKARRRLDAVQCRVKYDLAERFVHCVSIMSAQQSPPPSILSLVMDHFGYKTELPFLDTMCSCIRHPLYYWHPPIPPSLLMPWRNILDV